MTIAWAIGNNVATELVDETPTLERGTVITLSFLFDATEGTAHEDDTLHDDGTFHGDTLGTFRELRDRLAFTGASVRTGTSDTGVPWIRERLPDRAPVDSQIVLVDPGGDVIDAEPFWAVVVGGGDNTRPTNSDHPRLLELDLFVLAEGSQYNDRGELLDDIGSEVI